MIGRRATRSRLVANLKQSLRAKEVVPRFYAKARVGLDIDWLPIAIDEDTNLLDDVLSLLSRFVFPSGRSRSSPFDS